MLRRHWKQSASIIIINHYRGKRRHCRFHACAAPDAAKRLRLVLGHRQFLTASSFDIRRHIDGEEIAVRAVRQHAPELRVQRWIGAEGETLQMPVKLSDLGTSMKILFAFQDWCRGCHEHGFPTLQLLRAALAPRGVGFAAIQTVFEGEHENTFDKLRSNQQKYDLPIFFGHDMPLDGKGLPTFMTDYQSGGTPWFVIIDPGGRIVVADFHLDAKRLVAELMRA